jgi:vitamin B12 transporter
VSGALRVSANYAFLHATEPDSTDGRPVTEHRRPKHSGSIAADGAAGRWSYGASIAYVGSQLDTRDNYPYDVARLHSYWLAGVRVAYAIKPGIELYARGSNLLDERYENSVGYHTEGRGLFAGLRLSSR